MIIWLPAMETFKYAVSNPSEMFHSPFELVKDATLSLQQRIALLKNWAWDMHELLVADDENMKSNNDYAGELLKEIHTAIAQLQNAYAMKNAGDSVVTRGSSLPKLADDER
jgi:hypothetical protein